MDGQTIRIAAVLGGMLLCALTSALVRVLWPDWSVAKWLNEREARDTLFRRHRDGHDGYDGGWFDTDCDGGGGD